MTKLYYWGRLWPARRKMTNRAASLYWSTEQMKIAADKVAQSARQRRQYLLMTTEHEPTDKRIGNVVCIYVTADEDMGIVGVVTDPLEVELWRAKLDSGQRVGLSPKYSAEKIIHAITNELLAIENHTLFHASLTMSPDHGEQGTYVEYASTNPAEFWRAFRNYANSSSNVMYLNEKDKRSLQRLDLIQLVAEKTPTSSRTELDHRFGKHTPIKTEKVFVLRGEGVTEAIRDDLVGSGVGLELMASFGVLPDAPLSPAEPASAGSVETQPIEQTEDTMQIDETNKTPDLPNSEQAVSSQLESEPQKPGDNAKELNLDPSVDFELTPQIDMAQAQPTLPIMADQQQPQTGGAQPMEGVQPTGIPATTPIATPTTATTPTPAVTPGATPVISPQVTAPVADPVVDGSAAKKPATEAAVNSAAQPAKVDQLAIQSNAASAAPVVATDIQALVARLQEQEKTQQEMQALFEKKIAEERTKQNEEMQQAVKKAEQDALAKFQLEQRNKELVKKRADLESAMMELGPEGDQMRQLLDISLADADPDKAEKYMGTMSQVVMAQSSRMKGRSSFGTTPSTTDLERQLHEMHGKVLAPSKAPEFAAVPSPAQQEAQKQTEQTTSAATAQSGNEQQQASMQQPVQPAFVFLDLGKKRSAQELVDASFNRVVAPEAGVVKREEVVAQSSSGLSYRTSPFANLTPADLQRQREIEANRAAMQKAFEPGTPEYNEARFKRDAQAKRLAAGFEDVMDRFKEHHNRYTRTVWETPRGQIKKFSPLPEGETLKNMYFHSDSINDEVTAQMYDPRREDGGAEHATEGEWIQMAGPRSNYMFDDMFGGNHRASGKRSHNEAF